MKRKNPSSGRKIGTLLLVVGLVIIAVGVFTWVSQIEGQAGKVSPVIGCSIDDPQGLDGRGITRVARADGTVESFPEKCANGRVVTVVCVTKGTTTHLQSQFKACPQGSDCVDGACRPRTEMVGLTLH